MTEGRTRHFNYSVCCPDFDGARCTSVVQRPLMVRCVIELTPPGRPVELFLVPASVTMAVVCAVLSLG